MLCELTGTPDQQINPVDDIEFMPDTPSEMVYNFLNGEDVEQIDLNRADRNYLAGDFQELIDIYRSFKFDPLLTRDENRYEKLCAIDDYLSEKLLGYIK